MMELREAYLDLLGKTLVRAYDKEPLGLIPPNYKTPLRTVRTVCYNAVNAVLRPMNLAVAQTNRPTGESMLDLPRLDNIRVCIETVLRDGIEGDFLEAGVWRGGASIFMKGCLYAHGDTKRTVWLADSFAGLPKPDPRYPADERSKFAFWRQTLGVPASVVRANFEKYGLLDERVRFLEGFFADTLPNASVERLAILRCDGDMYSSTMDTLVNLYPKLSPGGFCIVDDYGSVPECAEAVHDYRAEHGIAAPIERVMWLPNVPGTAAFWRRGR